MTKDEPYPETIKELFTDIPVLQSGRLTLRQVTDGDAEGIEELASDPDVLRYLPAFLFERKYDDGHEVIRRLYTECLEADGSLILGMYLEGRFCGLAEMYGYRGAIRKISIGHRILRWAWGKGISSTCLDLMIDYLISEKGIGIITASSMVENAAAAAVLTKCGFTLVVSGAQEDWGYDQPTPANKWIR